MSSQFYLEADEDKRWRRYLSLVAQNYTKHTGFLDLVHLLICLYEYSVARIATANRDVFKSSSLIRACPRSKTAIRNLTRIRHAAVHRPTGPYNLYEMLLEFLSHNEQISIFLNEVIIIDDTLCLSYVSCAINTAYVSMIENKKVGDL